MGNLIKDFWVYQYKNKEYYGVVEVVSGEVSYNRSAEKKNETRIEKALQYMLKPGLRILSHMSVQAYNQYLNKDGRPKREENEETFYPMLVEFEPPKDAFDFIGEYKNMSFEAFRLVSYLIYDMDIDERDILIMINNSRSIYVMINPVSYELRPGRNLHRIYKEIYNRLNEIINFQYADEKMYRYNGLMKTPNCFYKGGYFVPISFEELKKLMGNPDMKNELTKEKRSLDYTIPGEVAPQFAELYKAAKQKILEEDKEHARAHQKNNGQALHPEASTKVTYANFEKLPNCIEHIFNSKIEVGKRNSALVTIAIHYRNQGYSLKQVEDILLELANKWNHDENDSIVRGIAGSVFRNNTKFSCIKGARRRLKLDDSFCRSCPFNKNRGNTEEKNYTKFKIQKAVINDLWEKKASLRHYKAYLELARKNLFNKWFAIETVSLTTRTIKELCRSTSNLVFTQNGESVMVYNKALDKGTQYLIPNIFWDNEVYNQLNEHLKHYLKLIFTGYKTNSSGRYIQSRVSKERIKNILGYKTINGVYKLFSKLSGLGMTVFNKGYLFAIYFESYKVIDITQYQDDKEWATYLHKAADRDDGLSIIDNVMGDRSSPELDTG